MILPRILVAFSWVYFWVHSRKITPLDDVNSFLFNAYSVSSKKVYAIRAPDHPPKALESLDSKAFFFPHYPPETGFYHLFITIDRFGFDDT